MATTPLPSRLSQTFQWTELNYWCVLLSAVKQPTETAYCIYGHYSRVLVSTAPLVLHFKPKAAQHYVAVILLAYWHESFASVCVCLHFCCIWAGTSMCQEHNKIHLFSLTLLVCMSGTFPLCFSPPGMMTARQPLEIPLSGLKWLVRVWDEPRSNTTGGGASIVMWWSGEEKDGKAVFINCCKVATLAEKGRFNLNSESTRRLWSVIVQLANQAEKVGFKVIVSYKH